ncbi:MAG: HAMP domain-containing protein [Deltaproteobacteria bacterium]|nr:HAMP domain-containing protein [Deltaproteobacteria bacterium]
MGFLQLAQDVEDVLYCMKVTHGTDTALLARGSAGGMVVLNASSDSAASAAFVPLADLLERGLAEEVLDLRAIAGGHYAVGVAPVADASGATLGVMSSNLDVTARVAAMWRGIVAIIVVFDGLMILSGLFHFVSLRRSVALFFSLGRHVRSVTSTWDLTRPLDVPVADEVGQLGRDFNRLTESLAAVVRSVRGSAGEMDLVASELRRASADLTESTRGLADQARESREAVARVEASITRVAGSAAALDVSADETRTLVDALASQARDVATHAEDLARSFESVATSTEEVAGTSAEVGDHVDALVLSASEAGRCAETMERTTATVEQITSEAATIAAEVLAEAQRGQQSVAETVAGMALIPASSELAVDRIMRLATSVESIGGILSVIERLASQASLLALNASILAAQEGTRGHGFGVVAAEMKDLAERTRSATHEIGAFIITIRSETDEAVHAVRQGVVHSLDGEARARQSDEALTGIVAGMRPSDQKLGETVAAMAAQADASRVVRSTVARLRQRVDQIAQANREQGQASQRIREAIDHAHLVSARVHSTSRAQSQASGSASRAVTGMSRMTRAIREATERQRDGVASITRAVGTMERASGGNLDAVRLMEVSVGRLGGQVRALQREAGRFTAGPTGGTAP